MKKEEIKKDIIRETLISSVQYLSENTYIVWSSLIGISLIISIVTFHVFDQIITVGHKIRGGYSLALLDLGALYYVKTEKIFFRIFLFFDPPQIHRTF